MLLIILIGAALRHARPESAPDAKKADADVLRHRPLCERCTSGVAVVRATASPPRNPAPRADTTSAHAWGRTDGAIRSGWRPV